MHYEYISSLIVIVKGTTRKLTMHCHGQEDEIGASLEQNTNKEDLDLGKCQDIFAAY